MVNFVIISCALLVACDAQFVFPGLGDLTSVIGSPAKQAQAGASALQQTGAQGISAVTSLFGMGGKQTSGIDAIGKQFQSGASALQNGASSATGALQNLFGGGTAGASSPLPLPDLSAAATGLGAIAQQAQSGASMLEGSMNSAKNLLENSASSLQNGVNGLIGNWQGQVNELGSTTDPNTLRQCLSSNMNFGNRANEISEKATRCLTSAMSALTSDYMSVSSKIANFNLKLSESKRKEEACGTSWLAWMCKANVWVGGGINIAAEWATLFGQMKTVSNAQQTGDICDVATSLQKLGSESETSMNNIKQCISGAFADPKPSFPLEFPIELPKELPIGLPKDLPIGLPKELPIGLPKELPKELPIKIPFLS